MADKVTALATRDPMDLLAVAVEKGAGVETIERLVALAERVQAMRAKTAYNGAMASFQTECPTIAKDSEGKAGGAKYLYAQLPTIMAAIRPHLRKHNFSVRWQSVACPAGSVGSECIVTHADGHSESSGPVVVPVATFAGPSGAQHAGAAHTYSERYSLKKVLGITPDDDPDAPEPDTEEHRDEPAQRQETGDPWLVCPLCQKKTLMKSKVGSGYYCFPKRGGCGKQVADPASDVPF